MSATVEDYEAAKAVVIEKLIEWLQVGNQIGRPEAQMAGEFFASFQAAAQEALNGPA